MNDKPFSDATFTEVTSAMALAAMLGNAETIKVLSKIATDRLENVDAVLARTAIGAAKALTANL